MPAMRPVWGLIGAASLCGVIVYGLPVIGVPALASPDLRLWLLVGVFAVVGGGLALGFWRERARADALEAGLVRGYAGQADPTGEARLLAVRMANVLTQMKQKGGRGYLYARPWYVIIGPPGVGKTTALQHCGVPFQTLGRDGFAPEGIGGTRNVDWWFAEPAVLLDTAGRYVTQESDRARDIAGWGELLRLLRTHRPRQPVNGVILAFSVEDLLFGTRDSIAWHAATVRARLDEIREVLGIDVPVYVLFTKVDLVAGFRERFGRLTPQDRQAIWGHTFQTSDRGADTATGVGPAFDRLLGRLTDSTVAEIAQDHDGLSRIAGFSFPTQMAILKPKVESFLANVFAPPTRVARHRAILRGFYFASGTQDGTPFDQILGVLARDRGAEAPQDRAHGRHGKSYFLHDLLTRVVFAEQGWVGHDPRRAARRRRLRRLGLASVVAATLAVMAGVAVRYWTTATLVAEAEAAAAAYFADAAALLAQPVVADADPRPVLGYLDALRDLPGRVPPPAPAWRWPGFGLDRGAVIAAATTQAYGDGLERLLRPRLMLALENVLLADLAAGPAHPDPGAVFQRLHAYLHLANHPDSRGDGDAAVLQVFARQWRGDMAEDTAEDTAAALRTHLLALRALDDGGRTAVSADAALVAQVRDMLGALPLATQVIALLDTRSFAEGLADLVVADAIPRAADLFRTTDGRPVASVFVPGLFTDVGARRFVSGAAGDAAEIWRAHRWILDDGGVPASVVDQLAALDADVARAYRRAAARAWETLFQTLALQPITADARGVARLARLGDRTDTPLRRIAQMAAAAPPALPDPALWQAFALSDLDAVTAAFAALERSVRTAVDNPSAVADADVSRDLARLSASAAPAPDAVNRMVAATVATLRDPDPARAAADLRRAVQADIVLPCRAELAGRYPFAAPDAAGSVPIPVFAAYFAPGGRVATFVSRHLAGHVVRTADGLRPDVGGLLASRLDDGLLEHLDRAAAIRDAFFMDGTDLPAVVLALALTDAAPDVAQVFVTVQGTTVILTPGGPAVPVVWTGAGAGLTIQLADPQGRVIGGFEQVRDGWDVARWLGSAPVDDAGATVALRTEIAGRMIAIRATVDGAPVPFGMAALRDLRCPRALE